MSCNDCFSFQCKWFDPHAQLMRNYQMMFYVRSSVNEIELTDTKTRKLFLRRTPFPSIAFSDLFIGSKLMVYSRQMEIVAFGDPHTARRFGSATTFACVAEDGAALGAALKAATRGFRIVKAKLLGGAERPEAAQYFGAGGIAPSARIVALELSSLGDPADVVGKWQKYAAGQRGIYAAPDSASARASVDAVFGAGRAPQSASFAAHAESDATLMLVKPHAVHEGAVGDVVQRCVDGGFAIEALESFVLDKTQAAEFLEVYKGVSPVYTDAVNELSNGPCVAIALSRSGGGAVDAARALAGPHEYAYADQLRRQTLRAKFGRNDVQNAVHTTDLADDAALELEFFFALMQ